MNNKKMIVMDLDGTLLNKKKTVTKISKEYLKQIKENGNIIVIASGRILNSVLMATDEAEFVNYIISDAGGAGYKKEDENEKWEQVFINKIEKETAKKLLTYFEKEKMRCISICDKNFIRRLTNEYFENNPIIKNFTESQNILEETKEILHIDVDFKNNDFVDEYKKIFVNDFPTLDIKVMQDSFDKERWLDISQKGIQKYKGISQIAKIENIPNENIIAFGDGLNDIDMLQHSGIGIAMKNALPEVKEISNYVTEKTNDEDGVIAFLEKYLK